MNGVRFALFALATRAGGEQPFHRCLGGTAIRRRVEQDLKRSK
jgi:hypothetical protein